MNTYYVTFPQRYRTEAHPLNELVDPDGYALVHAEDVTEATELTRKTLHEYWADVYDEFTFEPTHYPLGELFSIR